MQLKSIGQPEQCMTIQQNFIRGAGASNLSLDPLTTKQLPYSNKGNVNRIALETCSPSINPNQTWFVGS